ncbi:hypothetical protein [Vibrio navarrensis]|uniref:hypothetical protein n=1 Tax=Vibrio navarrensis TaxID=29495 RepID=UPI0018DBD80F|nr:hypothetical protein [Vibrio navarrensis]MBH9740649.1 hypothetical protein [Vibrio navarrensis]
MNLRINPQTKQKVVAFYVIIALLFQIYLLATMALNPSQVNQQNWLSDSQGGKVLLCTAQGFKWVDISELIEANNLETSDADSGHENLKFHCPLLKACQFSLSLAVLCLAVILAWLSRPAPTRIFYQHLLCLQKVYLSIAPKQSPPHSFFA